MQVRHKRAAMRLFEFAKAVQVTAEPTQSFGTWFRHESPYQLDELRPLTYFELSQIRPDYDISARRETELVYHDITSQVATRSFLYATIVGFNRMEVPEDYPGFTYYFMMTPEQVDACIFDIVDAQKWMEPTKGQAGLKRAQQLWLAHNSEFEKHMESGLGTIDPRIEVVIPFSVRPVLFFPQIEDR